jgi:hypothetical protein
MELLSRGPKKAVEHWLRRLGKFPQLSLYRLEQQPLFSAASISQMNGILEKPRIAYPDHSTLSRHLYMA